MPRKHFKKYLPSYESVRATRYIGTLASERYHPNLWHLNRRSVAGGVAIGMLCGMIPVPVQMLCAAILALALRVNLPVAMAATWYVNPFTVVPLYYLAYRIGTLITGDALPAGRSPELEVHFQNISRWIPMLITWVEATGKPLLIGLCALGAALATAGYVAVRGAWRLYVLAVWRRRQRTRRQRFMEIT